MKLKIFSDRCFLPAGIPHEPIFYPFWGSAPEKLALPGAAYYEAFDRYLEVGKTCFELVPLEAADVVIFPGNLERVFCPEYLCLATDLAAQAKQAGKPTLGFFWGDCSDIQLPIACDIVLRNSLYRTSRSPSDFAYPNWTVDFTATYFDGSVPIRQKSAKPTIGFCGFIGQPNLKLYAKQLLYQFRKIAGRGFPPPHYTGHLFRDKALAWLSKSDRVQTNFILRDRMGFVGQSPEIHQIYRMEYVNNMKDSDYILCCRGYGNYSYRLYEILSAGRIPVFIDTDCVLPYDFELDWKTYCIWISQRELPKIGEVIAEFHENLSPQDFIDLQHKCYDLWKKRLSPEGFFGNLNKHLISAPKIEQQAI